jgi:hypothetical protein
MDPISNGGNAEFKPIPFFHRDIPAFIQKLLHPHHSFAFSAQVNKDRLFGDLHDDAGYDTSRVEISSGLMSLWEKVSFLLLLPSAYPWSLLLSYFKSRRKSSGVKKSLTTGDCALRFFHVFCFSQLIFGSRHSISIIK